MIVGLIDRTLVVNWQGHRDYRVELLLKPPYVDSLPAFGSCYMFLDDIDASAFLIPPIQIVRYNTHTIARLRYSTKELDAW